MIAFNSFLVSIESTLCNVDLYHEIIGFISEIIGFSVRLRQKTNDEKNFFILFHFLTLKCAKYRFETELYVERIILLLRGLEIDIECNDVGASE